MAGFFAHFGSPQPSRLVQAAERLRYADEREESFIGDGFSFVWSGLNDAELFGPAHDPETGVRVVTAGRVSWDEPDWQRAEGFVRFEGGLTNRLLLDAYLREGIAGVERHNGPALLVIWDPRDRRAHLMTDHLGYHPVFLYRPDDPERCVICTHPDVLADDQDVSTTPDLATMAEFLRFWRATPPHTYYNEVKYAGPASHWTWDLSSSHVSQRAYWIPYQEAPFPDVEAAAEELAVALRHSVRIRTLPRLSPTLVYISGGMDSRTILFAAADPERTVGLNLYDVPNRESRISRQICDAAGVRYEGFARDEDYYPRWMPEGVRLSGGMWSAEDYHFHGTAERVRELGIRTVMTGCTADRVFKATPMESRYKRLFGRNLPVKELVPARQDAFLPNHPHPAPPAFREAMDARFEAWFEGTPRVFREERDWLQVEDRRIRPNCYASSVSGPMMYRIFPYDTFLADRAVIDCYSRLRPEWKLNSVVWGKAVARVSGAHRDLPVANFDWHLDDPLPIRLAAFARGWVRRRLHRSATVAGQGPATDGSWPWLGWYVLHSDTFRAMWEGAPAEDRELMTAVWGGNPWETPAERWAHSPNGAFRILTLLNHWQVRRDASSPVMATS